MSGRPRNLTPSQRNAIAYMLKSGGGWTSDEEGVRVTAQTLRSLERRGLATLGFVDVGGGGKRDYRIDSAILTEAGRASFRLVPPGA